MPNTPQSEREPALQVGRVLGAGASEWRVGDRLAPRHSAAWQLVFVLDGVIEETVDARRVLVRAGRAVFHQPEESWSMRAVGEVPPEVLRVSFEASGTVMDLFRGRMTRVSPPEQNVLRLLAETVRETWAPTPPDAEPQRKAEPPFGAVRLSELYLEQFLWLAARRLRRTTRKPSPRALAEQNQNAMVDAARLYFSEHLEQDPTLAEVCHAVGCGRAALQQAFRARTGLSPREYFVRLKAERAGALLAQGHAPGEVAGMLGYSSVSYFSQVFRALTGRTPTAYRKDPQPLHLCNK